MKARPPQPLVVIGSALLFAAGCATVQRYPVVPIRVQLVSPTPFMVHVRARGDTAATFCEVLQLSGAVAEVRGDTLEFETVRSERRPYHAADCLEGRPGYLVLSTAPDLQAVTTRWDQREARNGRLLLVPFSLLIALFLLAGG